MEPSSISQQATQPNTNQPPPAQGNPPQENPKKSGLVSKWPYLIIIALIIIVVLLTVYLFWTRSSNNSQTTTPTPTSSNIQTPTPTDSSLQNYETYINEEQNWQIDYPTNEDFEINTFEETQIGQNGIGEVVVFQKVGPTQAEGTEFFDGISVSIGLKQKSANQAIMEFADQDSEPDPNISTRTPLENITINGHQGIQTTVSGLGESRLIYLAYPVRADRVYYISIIAVGSDMQTEQEYEEIVENMLSAFKSYR